MNKYTQKEIVEKIDGIKLLESKHWLDKVFLPTMKKLKLITVKHVKNKDQLMAVPTTPLIFVVALFGTVVSVVKILIVPIVEAIIELFKAYKENTVYEKSEIKSNWQMFAVAKENYEKPIIKKEK